MADQNSMETQPQDPPKESTEGSRDRDKDRDRRSDRDRERRSDRDRDRTRDRRSDRRDRDRDRDRDRERRRDRSASPKRDRSRDRSRRNRSSERRRERDEFDPPTREEEATKNRDDYTIFVHQIHPKVDDRDLFDFFSHVGRVLDIRLIRDQRTLKSKGLAYIEFWQQDSTTKAIALNGCELGGYPISVSQAQTDTSGSSELPDIPMRLYVGSVHPDVAEDDLKQIFEAFGPLMGVQLGKDASGENQHAYVTYKKETDAKQALGALNGLEIAGRAIKVGVVDMAQQGFNLDSAGELDDSYGGLNMTAQGRQALMAKLGRGTITGIAPPPNMAAPAQTGGSGIMSAQSLAVPLIQPTTCLVIKNMFDPATETDPEFHLDIQEDIEEEVEKLGIKLSHIHVDKKHPSGHVFLRLDSIETSKTVAKSFHGRWFASRQITAEFVPEATYFSRFPKE